MHKSSAVAEVGDYSHNRHGPKREGLLCPFRGGELGPRLTQVAWAQVYFRTKWRLSPCSRLATIDMGQMGQKLGGAVHWVPTEHKIAWAEAYIHTKWHFSPSSRLATTDIGRRLGGALPL